MALSGFGMASVGQSGWLRVGMAALVLAWVPALGGCNGFFVCQGKASCPSSGTGTTSTDYVFISNSSSGSDNINGYQVSGGTFVQASGSPITMAAVPVSMVVTPNDDYLYVAEENGNIYGYSIGSGGALTQVTVVGESSLAIDVSPDGDYLYSLNYDYATVEVFAIGSGGSLTKTGAANYPSGIAQNSTPVYGNGIMGYLKVAPSGDFLAVSVAGQLTNILPLSSDLPTAAVNGTSNTSTGNYALAIDSSNYVYVVNQATTTNAGLAVYPVSSSGAVSSPKYYSIGSPTGDSAIAFNSSYSELFVGTGSSIYQFTLSGGVPTANTTAASAIGPTSVAEMARDNTGDYIIAGGYSSSSGLQLFSIGSNGTLTEETNTATGTTTTVPMVIAASH